MADMIPQGVQREGVDGGYERGDANIRSVVVAMTIIMSAVLIVMVVALGGFHALRLREEAKDVAFARTAVARVIPPEPRLLPSPLTARDNILPWERGAIEMSEQKTALTRYGFTDKARGQVTIPVEQAMRDVLQQNLPARAIPANRNDLANGFDTGAQPVADADLDGSMVPDTTGGRVLDDEAFLANKPLGANDISLGSGNLAASSSGETMTKSLETGASNMTSGSAMYSAINPTPRPQTTTSATTTSAATTRNNNQNAKRDLSAMRRDVAPVGAR